MHDFTGFQRDCLVAASGLDGPKGLEVERELDGDYQGDIDHGRRNFQARDEWDSDHVESNE
ncbi:hypothetical protein [Halorientalis pallida]|uniref:Uncharacterized protein n=1 Tax=Halorientalis pallida TaxID=2479928 RepID=A0A498L3J9_9EURY|nr:hypothetical protein [Halorientalis pallida]RXK50374.1 hypothetical protein EAF64_07415 [Halorientalis pallida]